MALVLKDRVKVTSGSTGTGTFTLGSAVIGFQDFAAIGDGNTTYYTIALQSGTEWEVGVGTVTDTGGGVYTLTRNTILESSNSGSAVNFSAGTKDVFVTYPAERAVYLNSAGSAVDVLDIGTIGASTANITTANITSGTLTTTPVNSTDLVNKQYVDETAEGLKAKPSAELATTANLTATYDNGTAGVGATLTATTNGAFPTIDGVTLTSTTPGQNGVLVKNQTNPAENGRYNLTTLGDAGTPWVLTRCPLCDEADEIPGAYVFVKSGTLNGNTGWVQTVLDPATFVVGTDAIIVVQFFGAGTYTAGTGLTLTGTEFSITDVGTAGTYGTASQVPVFTTNAQGQVTGVTNTSIAISSSAVSGLAASATTDTTNAANITSGTLNTARINGAYTGITGVGTLTAGTWNATTIAPNYGGTGITSYTVGDLLYADGTTSLAKLAGVATGNALISGGVGTAPAWGKIGLNTHVSGTLPIANGGTGETTASAAINALVPSQTGNAGKYLSTNGTAVSWQPSSSANYVYRTSNYSAASNDVVLTDTSGGGFTVILPAAPVLGSTVIVADAASSWGTNNLIVERNGSTIDGAASNLTCDIDGVSVQLIYDGTTWNVYAQVGAGLAQIAANVLYSNTTSGLAATDVQAAIDELSAEKLEANNPSYTGTLTGGTGVINIGSGQLVKDASGNVGIGVTPSTMSAGVKAIQIGVGSADGFFYGLGGNDTEITTNAYFNSGYKYQTSGIAATRYFQSAGIHAWSVAPSGTAGNAISFTEAMRITSAGNVGIGTSSPVARFEVQGAARIGTAVSTSYVRVAHDTANGLIDTNVGALGYAVPSSQFHYWAVGGTERMRINSSGMVLPGANNTYDLGSTSLRWRNIFTNDLHLSNEGSKNSVDGTWGDWTIQEGETDLYLLNNRSGKRYKFALTEVPQE
jgi:hypothetical protein